MLFLVDSPFPLVYFSVDDFTNPTHFVFYILKPDRDPPIILNFEKQRINNAATYRILRQRKGILALQLSQTKNKLRNIKETNQRKEKKSCRNIET